MGELTDDFKGLADARWSLSDDERVLWAQLSAAKRQDALARLQSVLEYEALERPGRQQVERLARQVGMSATRYYLMLKRWSQWRTPLALLPRLSKVARPGKLPPNVSETVDTCLTKALKMDPSVTAYRATALAIEACREAGVKPPTPRNIGIRFAKLRAQLPGGAVPVRSSKGGRGADATFASEFGEVVDIDQSVLDLNVVGVSGLRRASRPVATFALDHFSGLILGSAIDTDFDPIDALSNALERLSRFADVGPWSATPPKFVVASALPGRAHDFTKIADLQESGVEVEVLTGERQAGSLLGAFATFDFEGLRILPRYRNPSEEVNPAADQTTVLTFADAQIVLAKAIEKHNQRRRRVIGTGANVDDILRTPLARTLNAVTRTFRRRRRRKAPTSSGS